MIAKLEWAYSNAQQQNIEQLQNPIMVVTINIAFIINMILLNITDSITIIFMFTLNVANRVAIPVKHFALNGANIITIILKTRPHCAVGNVSDCRYMSHCRSMDREFDPGPVPYIPGDWS